MIIEKIVFGVLSIALFTIFFLKMIGKNNATYVYLLVVQFIGMLISFLELIFSIKLKCNNKINIISIGYNHTNCNNYYRKNKKSTISRII